MTSLVHISLCSFGEVLNETDGNIIVSDVGDIKLTIEDDAGESFATMNPDDAEKVAENLLIAVHEARRLIQQDKKS